MSRRRKRDQAAAADSRPIRCAIYTRKSSEEGLDQEFNSLDAPRNPSFSSRTRSESRPRLRLSDWWIASGLDANAGRHDRLAEELAVMRSLPRRRIDSARRMQVRVDHGSLIRVDKNVYSVNSRLIGETLSVVIRVDELELWYAQKLVDRLPRLRGSGKHLINYRHVIDGLVRKPGAFEDYRYREDLFPTTRFRIAYDLLNTHGHGARRYLAILELAAKSSEDAVDDALCRLIDRCDVIDFDAIERMVDDRLGPRPQTAVEVVIPGLGTYDALLSTDLIEEVAA